jgi:hypothetical protein
MKQVSFDLQMLWITSHNKEIKDKETYRTFNKGILTNQELESYIKELVEGNKLVDALVESMTN